MLLFLGKFHPLLIHFPIALIYLLVLLEWINWKRQENHSESTRIIVGFFLLTTILAQLAGYFLKESGIFTSDLIEIHMYLGVASSLFAFGLFFSFLSIQEKGPGIYRIFLVLTFVCMTVTGFYGGWVRYGDGYFSQKKYKPSSQRQIDAYYQHVQPIFNRRCVSCHGPRSTRPNLLRLDNLDRLAWGGWSGSVLVPGKKEQSVLYRRIILPPDDPKHMPLEKGSLTKKEVQIIGEWIDRGAYGEGFSPNVAQQSMWITDDFEKPKVKNNKDGLNPIDFFLARKLKKKGLRRAGKALPHELVRRFSYQLTGLPPTQKLKESFQKNPSIFDLTQTLINSNAYGEHWARLLLDLYAYADSTGDSPDADKRGAYFFRDQIIKAVSEDWPIDKIIRFQLAGDLFQDQEYPNSEILSSNLYLGPDLFTNNPGLAIFSKHQNMMERTVYSHLGIDISCARCHNHPELPISQRSYYQLISGFINVEVLHLAPREKLIDDDHAFKMALKKAHPDFKMNPRFHQKMRQYYARQKPLEIITRPDTESVHVRERGVFHKKGERVEFAFPRLFERGNNKAEFWRQKILSEFPHMRNSRHNVDRLALAHWLTDPEAGVGRYVARVFVDQVWRAHFGRSLVNSPKDWSQQTTEAPLHEDILHWLTHYFIENGWSLKKLNTIISNAQIYSRSSSESQISEDQARNYYNKWYPVKMTAEMVRDAVNFVGKGLNLRRFGPADWTYLSQDVLISFSNQDWYYDPTRDIKERRSIYILRKRNSPYPPLAIFGQPKTDAPKLSRFQSDTMRQSLFFLNSRFIAKNTQALTMAILKESKDGQKQIELAFEKILHRKPSVRENELMQTFYKKRESTKEALYQIILTLFSLNEFIYIS